MMVLGPLWYRIIWKGAPMPVFISYSHADDVFATRLASQLVKHKATVWIDQWELHVGDSLIQRIQDAIQGASALLVILSKASVQSEWCKKELSTGLIRELDEKRVVVLPVVIEDCEIPLFLRDKLYADFRTDFDTGLRAVLEAIAKVTSESQVRVDNPRWHVDWAVDWGEEDRHFFMYLTAVEQAVGNPYTVLTEIRVTANEIGTSRYRALLDVGLDWVERAALIDLLCEGAEEHDVRIILEDEKAKTRQMYFKDRSSDARYCVTIRSRRLGEDTGRDVILDIAGQLRALQAGRQGGLRPLTAEEQSQLRTIQNVFAASKSNPFDHIAF
jgi:hypothetical protein